MIFYTYVLYSEKFDAFYYGQTHDLDSRLAKHNSGLVKSSARYLPWKIYAYQEFPTRSAAFIMEKKLKNCKSRNCIKDLIIRHEFIIQSSQKVFGPEN